jgi:hypothetical protein
MVSWKNILYGLEQNHESQIIGFARKAVSESLVSRCWLEQIKIVTLIEFLNILFRTFTGE